MVKRTTKKINLSSNIAAKLVEKAMLRVLPNTLKDKQTLETKPRLTLS